jgi:Bacterial Ig domain
MQKLKNKFNSMKIKFNNCGILGGILSLVLASAVFGQTNIQFTGVSATPEGAINLSWSSTNGELYQIQYANALATNTDGSTAWQVLYDGYPSHGTNTIVGDYGNYDSTPAVVHPKNMPTRFYRILDEGADTAASPTVSILSPTNGQVFSGQMTVLVVATSSLPVLTTKLYVDGQEMYESDDGSNYVINTCEWLNGTHTLYAVATARSGMSGPSGTYPIYTGHGVSSYIPVTFSNLVSEVAFSQVFFEPSLGQTQEVTANFAANCDWTLQIQDENSNTVRNASGSGNSMVFDWDGTGDGETNIADGYYTYLISAETNGLADEIVTSPVGGGGGGSLPSPSLAMSGRGFDDTQLWAMTDDNSSAVPLAIYPPSYDTNNLIIFSASASQVREASADLVTHSFTPLASYAGPSGQSTAAPTRPSVAPAKNAAGNYAIGYYSWPTAQTFNIPQNYTLGVCHLDGSSANGVRFDNIPEAQTMAKNMAKTMTQYAWKVGTIKGDADLPVRSIERSDLSIGGGEYFTSSTIGLFLDHGDYGTDPDYNPGSSGSKQVYFRSDVDSGENGWLRMCQFGFGGNLKWMAILACNSVCDPNYSSMKNAGAIPLKTTHLICGASTIAAVGEEIGADWTKNMLKRRQTIADAWFNAGRSQYEGATNISTTVFRIVGYPECMGDTVRANTAPSSPSAAPGNLTKQDSQVYP